MGCGWLATLLDSEMLQVQRGVQIQPATTPLNQLARKTGLQVAAEVGGRYLLRYLLRKQVGKFLGGSQAQHYVTPTPYSPDETTYFLALPRPTGRRRYVLLLDPARIPQVWGPRWVRLAAGIEYYLPQGFPPNAIVGPGWEIEVR